MLDAPTKGVVIFHWKIICLFYQMYTFIFSF